MTRTLTILEDDYSMMILFIHIKLAPKRILMLCLKCLHNVLKHNCNRYKIWKYTYVHSFPCPTIKYDKCDLMHFHVTIMWIWYYSHFDTSTSSSAKQFLPLFTFALAGLPFLFEAQTTLDMKSVNLIPCIGIQIRISSIRYNVFVC